MEENSISSFRIHDRSYSKHVNQTNASMAEDFVGYLASENK
jgi:hypothetical protein